jgi:hypothetical protein
LLNVRYFKLRGGFAYLAVFASFLPDSRLVVNALTGDLALTARANLTTKWLRRLPVLRGVVRFLGLPMKKKPPS